MRNFALLAAGTLSLSVITCVYSADEVQPESSPTEKKQVDKTPASQPATTQAAIINKKCPVGGEDVDPKGKTVAYKGKTVGFCCDECITDFKKDPDKYARKLNLKEPSPK